MIEKIVINDRESEYYTFMDPRDGFLVCLPKNCTLREFFNATKSKPNTYSSILVERLYHGLVTVTKNITEEYDKYYSKEYKDLSEFLFWKYCIPEKISKKCISQLQHDEVLLYSTYSSGCTSTVHAFIESDVMLESLQQILLNIRRMRYES